MVSFSFEEGRINSIEMCVLCAGVPKRLLASHDARQPQGECLAIFGCASLFLSNSKERIPECLFLKIITFNR